MKGEWISTKIPVPIGEHVLVYCEGEHYEAFRKINNNFIWWETIEGSTIEPSAWQLLPAPPEVK